MVLGPIIIYMLFYNYHIHAQLPQNTNIFLIVNLFTWHMTTAM